MYKEIKIHVSLHKEGSRLTDVEEFSVSELKEIIEFIEKEVKKQSD